MPLATTDATRLMQCMQVSRVVPQRSSSSCREGHVPARQLANATLRSAATNRLDKDLLCIQGQWAHLDTGAASPPSGCGKHTRRRTARQAGMRPTASRRPRLTRRTRMRSVCGSTARIRCSSSSCRSVSALPRAAGRVVIPSRTRAACANVQPARRAACTGEGVGGVYRVHCHSAD